jgi:type II secretory pathway pseudopilin PulG
MKYPSKPLLAFTLVELIVVITIVWILSTIGFVSYSGYLAGARDSNRFSQLTKLSDSLQVYATTKSLPLPDTSIDITASGTIIAYQGVVGENVLETIDYTNGGKDPKDDSYFTYYLTKDRKSLQLLAFMEEELTQIDTGTIGTGIGKEVYAADYENRYPKVYGKKLWVLVSAETATFNTPAQEITVNQTSGLDVMNTNSNYTAYVDNETQISGTGSTLSFIRDGSSKSCKQILEKSPHQKNGNYFLYSPDTKSAYEVYCDMETDGGGWTLIASYVNGNFFRDCSDVWMNYGTNCSADCWEIAWSQTHCTTNEQKVIQDSEIQKLEQKYKISQSFGNLSSYKTADFVSPAYYSVWFEESMFADDTDFISYDFAGYSSSLNSMNDFYSTTNTTHFQIMIPYENSSLSTNVNGCDNFTLAIMSADIDGGDITNFDSRKYMYYSPVNTWPGWDWNNNGWCHFDDNSWWWAYRRLWWNTTKMSPYISWFVG